MPLNPDDSRESLLQIRLAALDDWPVIAEFNMRLAEETEGKRLDADTLGEGVRRLLAQPERGRYFVACQDGRVVGQMMHTFEWSDWRNGEIWWLQSVYVLPEFRQRGVFRALFAHVQDLAHASPDVVGIRLYVEDHNTRAQAAYASLGLERAGYTVMERIDRNKV
jgi:GNAT superfamily N-acetyltransferase